MGRGNEAAHGGKLRDDCGLEGSRFPQREGKNALEGEDSLDNGGSIGFKRIRGADRGVKPVGESVDVATTSTAGCC